MNRRANFRLALALMAIVTSACSAPVTNPRRTALCEATPPPARLVRYLSAQIDDALSPSYGLVLEDRDGIPTRILNLSAWQLESTGEIPASLAEELAIARTRWDAWRVRSAGAGAMQDDDFERFTDSILPEDAAHRICSPVAISQAALDAGDSISIGVGLNFAAHAAEAGDDDGIFLFPKISEPTGAYRTFERPEDVHLLDYEVELGFVVLEDIDLGALPNRDELDQRLAYFQANDVSDREPIITGTRAHFTEAKSLPGAYPMGPWLVHGADLRPFSDRCVRPLRMQLEVDEQGARSLRQYSDTSFMLNDAHALLVQVGELARKRLDQAGAPIVDAVFRKSNWQFPIAKRLTTHSGGERLILPAGSIVATGTPEGVSVQSPDVLAVTVRALAHFRDPFSQFLSEQREALDAEGYLEDGDIVEARIEQLGSQRWRVERKTPPAAAGVPTPLDPCRTR